MARVVVAEDEVGIREFLVETLELDGHEVSAAADGEAALALLRASGADVLLTDLRMPRLDGMALLRTVRAEMPEVEVVVLTAHGTVENAVEAMRLGAFDYLQKPVGSPAELRLLVRRAAERRALLDQRESLARDERLPPLTWGAPAMRPVVDALERVARTSATVLLVGESGTGKELAARFVHAASARAGGPFVAVNCAALSASLLESELFGHEKGAFTGAHARRRGRLELAAGGSFFLDEIGELAPGLQAKLLRVLQERTFERVGGSQALRADVRWIAATNRDLGAAIAAGGFREDLYHRVAVFPVRLPPLRERREDIAPLAEHLLAGLSAELGRPSLRLTDAAARWLAAAPWPGNVRELRNALERAAILTDTAAIELGTLAGLGASAGRSFEPRPDAAACTEPEPPAQPETLELAELERRTIQRALELAGGNRRRAAELLGIGERTLYDRLRRG